MEPTRSTGLLDLVQVLRWRWLTVVAVAAPFVLGAVAYAESLTPYYEAESVLSVSGRLEADGYIGADVVRLGAPTFAAYITAPATLDEVAEDLDVEPAALEDATATVASESNTLRITVRNDSPTAAARIANRLAEQVVAYAAAEGGPLEVGLVAEATAPVDPAGPPRRMIEAAALLVALGLGVAVALVQDRSQRRLRSVTEIEAVTGMPVIGQFPRFRHASDQPVTAFADPAVGTAVRSARINLERELSTGSLMVVTSSTEGEGKTLISSLMAIALSRIGLRVLLVDGDLRRPTLSRLVGGPTSGGLLGVLRGEDDVVDEVREEWFQNLAVLPTAPEPSAGELLTQEFPRLARQLRQAFDVVIVDAPPILGADEGRALASDATGTLFVVGNGTPAATVTDAVSALDSVHARTLGVVANRMRATVDPYATVRSSGNLRPTSSAGTWLRSS